MNSLVILDSDGTRLLAKYYDGRGKAAQKISEATLHKKSKAVSAKSAVEVMLVDNELVVFKSGAECRFYISGPIEEVKILSIHNYYNCAFNLTGMIIIAVFIVSSATAFVVGLVTRTS